MKCPCYLISPIKYNCPPGGRGVKKVQNFVHVVFERPHRGPHSRLKRQAVTPPRINDGSSLAPRHS